MSKRFVAISLPAALLGFVLATVTSTGSSCSGSSCLKVDGLTYAITESAEEGSVCQPNPGDGGLTFGTDGTTNGDPNAHWAQMGCTVLIAELTEDGGEIRTTVTLQDDHFTGESVALDPNGYDLRCHLEVDGTLPP